MTLKRASSSSLPPPSTHQSTTSSPRPFVIREAWSDTFSKEMKTLGHFLTTHKNVGIDVEFPGVVARPIAPQTRDALYDTMRCNVDMLNPIQIGISLRDDRGELPHFEGADVGAWQFNLRFSLAQDMFAPESIDLLEKAGVNFDAQEGYGISPQAFGELLIASGLVMNEELDVCVFHGGFVLGYLLKLCLGKDLPGSFEHFLDYVNVYLPVFWDVRQMMNKVNPKWAGGGLDALAAEFGVKREATLPVHQAGSDAYTTLRTFMAMKNQPRLLNPACECSLYALELKPRSAPSSPVGSSSSNTVFGGHATNAMGGDDVGNTPEKFLKTYSSFGR